MTPPESVKELPPLVMATVPPQVFVAGAAAAFFMLADGYVSVKATPVTALVSGLLIVIVIVAVPDTAIMFGLNVFVARGAFTTESVADAAVEVPALAVAIGPVLFV